MENTTLRINNMRIMLKEYLFNMEYISEDTAHYLVFETDEMNIDWRHATMKEAMLQAKQYLLDTNMIEE